MSCKTASILEAFSLLDLIQISKSPVCLGRPWKARAWATTIRYSIWYRLSNRIKSIKSRSKIIVSGNELPFQFFQENSRLSRWNSCSSIGWPQPTSQRRSGLPNVRRQGGLHPPSWLGSWPERFFFPFSSVLIHAKRTGEMPIANLRTKIHKMALFMDAGDQ